MSKPASEITINKLSANLESVINELFPILRNCIKGLSKLEGMQKAGNIDCNNYNDYKRILEINSYVLYVIIEVACAFHADFKSSIAIEKRINLKYIVQIISEFFKVVFIPLRSNKTLWNEVSVHLYSLGLDVAKFNIEESIEKYDNDYFQKDKDNRDITVHYDFDLVKLYEYLVNISEEKEARRLCDFMAITQPLNQLITLYSSLIIKSIQAEDTSILLESNAEDILFKKLKEELYPQIGSSLQHFAKLLDDNMHSYCFVEKLPNNLLSILGNSDLERIKAIHDYGKIAILLHYIYLDLGTAIRGYLQSESYIERRWNIIRINLIIYEGWKKIYLQQSDNEKSLWEQYIYSPLSLIDDKLIKDEVDTINTLLDSYKDNKSIEDIRKSYIHLIDRKKDNLPNLLNDLITLKPYDELNKSLAFLKLLPRIIKLNMKSMQLASEAESTYNKEKLQKPFNLIKTKISESKMSEDNKMKLLRTIEDVESKIMSLIK